MGKQSLSKSEMEVVRVLWGLENATVREVHELLAVERSVEFATVQTYLRRLEAKGYVKSKLEGRTRLYTARIRADRVIRETVDDMVGRLFGGKTMPLMRHLIQEGDMTPGEIAELRRLVDRLEGGQCDA